MSKMSVATIDAPEFINVNSINPLISECEIKVLYLGANRNKSFIDKNAAVAIGRTLPGSPIVGYFKKDKQDFADHGQQIIFDDEGMKVNDLTRPFGFVPTDAKVWFQKFVDTDEFGNETEREYLMTVGYLWTGQYEEAQKVYSSEDGNPQSMKLHDDTLDGYWTKNVKTGVDFFIINDAIIQNLCILGEDVAPCFEGADITAPKISASFSKDNNFVTTLFSMMKDLKDALNKEEGGNSMFDTNATIDPTAQVENDTQVNENFSNEEGKVDETIVVENQVNTEEFKKNPEDDSKDSEVNTEDNSKEDEEDDKKKVTENALDVNDEFAKKEEEEEPEEEEKDDKKAEKDYALLEQKYNELQQTYSALEKSYNELVEFKTTIENEKKDALIQEFYMLSDEDKKDVVDNKSIYSLEDIEAKLSVICVRKKVNFDLSSDTQSNVEDAAPTTYNLNELEQVDNLPAWLKAVEATKNRNQ